jgi:kumamolisin
MAGDRAQIAGSVVPRSATVHRVRPADPNQIVEITIVIRRPAAQPPGAGLRTRDEIEKSLSASADDIAAVTDFARRHGLVVLEVSPEKRMVRMQGPAKNMNSAFGIDLDYFDGPDGSFLSYDGPLTVESDLAARIVAVLGLHQAPAAKSRI